MNSMSHSVFDNNGVFFTKKGRGCIFGDNRVKSTILCQPKKRPILGTFVLGRWGKECFVFFDLSLSWILWCTPWVVWHKTRKTSFLIEPVQSYQPAGGWCYRCRCSLSPVYFHLRATESSFSCCNIKKILSIVSGVLSCESVLTKEGTCHSEVEGAGWLVCNLKSALYFKAIILALLL